VRRERLSAREGGGMKIAVVGVCCSGKTTLVEGLRSQGYDAYSVAQEHSGAKSMWARRRPDVLVVLDCEYETVRKRRSVPWGPQYLREQRYRLRHAREHCDLYIKTDHMTPQEVLKTVLEEIGGSRHVHNGEER